MSLPDLPFLAFLEKQGFFLYVEPLKSLGKKGKKLKKARKFLATKKARKSKKARKGRSGLGRGFWGQVQVGGGGWLSCKKK